MKQTAVEWLVEQLEQHYVKIDIKNTVVFEQAKAMEKQNIVDAYRFGIQDEYVIGSQQYYNKTFKQD